MVGSRGARLLVQGLFLVAMGFLVGVLYPYLLLFSDRDTAILVLRLSIAAFAVLLGAFLASLGVTLLVGWRLFYAKDTSEEQEGR